MAEQMAQRGSITSRVPQKYLIQNQSGLTVFYWTAPVRAQPQPSSWKTFCQEVWDRNIVQPHHLFLIDRASNTWWPAIED
jgi:hypothetical protein